MTNNIDLQTLHIKCTADDLELPASYLGELKTFANLEDKQGPFLLEFASLQHLNLMHIQNQLAFLKSSLSQSTSPQNSDLIHLRRLMHEYVTAIKDFRYMSNLSRIHDAGILTSRRTLLDSFFASISRSQNSYEPYDSALLGFPGIAVTDDDRARELLRKYLWRRFAWSKEERSSSAEASLRYDDGLPPHMYSSFVDRFARFLVAITGGVLLVCPMLVMSLNPSTTKSQITVSVAVMLFASLMSLAFRTDNKETLVATATYAAVLVVFVGTSSSTT